VSRTSNHARAPISAEIVTAYRAVFGEDVVANYVNENGLLKGEPTPEGAPCFTFREEEPRPKRRKKAA
jgi:hypothetical protein